MKAEPYRTPNQIALEGFAALVERLGPGGALQFLHQYELGQGDYTKERKEILRNVTLADLRKSLLATPRKRRKR
jgi:hypothetical protein